MNTLAIIKAHGLAIRQIPHITTHRWAGKGGTRMHPSYMPFFTRVKIGPKGYFGMKEYLLKHSSNDENEYGYRFDDDTQQVWRIDGREVKAPEHAGWWMCKPVDNTTCMVDWDAKKDNLAPTLEESVALYVSKLNQQTSHENNWNKEG